MPNEYHHDLGHHENQEQRLVKKVRRKVENEKESENLNNAAYYLITLTDKP